MEKLSEFFSKRKAEGVSAPIDENAFPELTAEEEKEIFDSLGLNPAAVANKPTVAAVAPEASTQRPPRVRDVVFGTLRSLKQVKVEEIPVETVESTPDVEDLGTVRIKLSDGRSKWGTLRRNKQNPSEIVLQDLDLEESSSSSDSESTSDATPMDTDTASSSGATPQLSGETDDDEIYSSVRIKDVSVLDSLENEFGTMRVKSDGASTTSSSEDTPLWMNSGQKSQTSSNQKFQWRQPEDWELAIIALERGEFDPTNMKDDAFRKYKKERPKLANLSSQFFVVEPAPASAPSTPPVKTKKRRGKNKSVDRTDKKDKKERKSKSSKRKSDSTNKSAAAGSPTAAESGGEKKERKWAAFKRNVDSRGSVGKDGN